VGKDAQRKWREAGRAIAPDESYPPMAFLLYITRKTIPI